MAFPLTAVPPKSDVFIDANIFINGIERKSLQCWDFLDRCSHEDIFGITSLNTLIEATHRLMTLEAAAKGLIRGGSGKPPYKQLKDSPAIVQTLRDYWTKINQIRSMNILVLDVDESAFNIAQNHRTGYGLLTNDSLISGVMEMFSLTVLATDDGDYDRVSFIKSYSPTDI